MRGRHGADAKATRVDACFLSSTSHICRAGCDKRTAVLAGAPCLPLAPPCRKAFQMAHVRCSRTEGRAGTGTAAMLARVPLDLVVDRTSEFSRQMVSTLQLAWTMMLLLFFFLKRSLQATTIAAAGSSSGSRFPSTPTLTTSS